VNRDTIIKELTDAHWLKQSCKKIGGYNYDDLYQEFMLVVLQKTENELIEIHPYLRWWCIRTLINISNPANQRKDFYKKYLQITTDITTIPEPICEPEYNHYEILYRAKAMVMNDTAVYWFDKELFTLYENGERYSTIAKRTRIHHKTVKEAIENIKHLIKNKYEHLAANCCDTQYGDNNS
jgi:hypothetical protein